jgi:hypothetical protein
LRKEKNKMTLSKYTVLSDIELFQITGGTDWWLLGSGIVAAAICIGAVIAQPAILVTPKFWTVAGSSVGAIAVGLNN